MSKQSKEVRPLVYTVKEAAIALKLSERSVWSLIYAGALKACRPSEGTVRILVTELERYLADRVYDRKERRECGVRSPPKLEGKGSEMGSGGSPN